MPLWRKLYNTVWLAFFACVLISRWMGSHVGMPVHVVLGVLLLIMTLSNVRRLSALPVPARLKRISRVTAGFAIVQTLSGMFLGGVVHLALNLPKVLAVMHGVHVVCALTILAQASSVATAYDMWEEKEFETAPASAKTDNI